jgi:hypothetical protein
MTNRLLLALRRLWTSLWTRSPIVVTTMHDEGGRRRADARARFWTAFREGQREADARLKPR